MLLNIQSLKINLIMFSTLYLKLDLNQKINQAKILIFMEPCTIFKLENVLSFVNINIGRIYNTIIIILLVLYFLYIVKREKMTHNLPKYNLTSTENLQQPLLSYT